MTADSAALRATVLEVLHQIAPEADLDALQPGDDLRRALEIDSFDFLRLLTGLQARLGVDFPEAIYGQLTTLDGLLGYLVTQRSA